MIPLSVVLRRYFVLLQNSNSGHRLWVSLFDIPPHHPILCLRYPMPRIALLHLSLPQHLRVSIQRFIHKPQHSTNA